MKLIPIDFQDQNQKWSEIVNMKLFDRPIYLSTDHEVQYSRVAKQILGIYGTEYEMQEYLHSLTNTTIQWTLIFNNLPKEISSESRTIIIDVLQRNKDKQISVNRFMSFFAGNKLLPLMDSPFKSHFIQVFCDWLVVLEGKYPKLVDNNVQRILLDFVKWSNHYFPQWESEYLQKQDVPHLLWYGEMKESEAFFMHFLYLFGCDLVIFNPNKADVMTEHGLNPMEVEQLEKSATNLEFPFEKPVQIQTITSQAEAVVGEHLYSNSALNHPWKYANYETRNRILNTTLEEVFQLNKADLYLREGFSSEDQIVYLPVLFTKIEGINENTTEYLNRIDKLVHRELSYFSSKFPLVQTQRNNMQFHLRDAKQNGVLIPEEIIKLSIWPYKQLSMGSQLNIARSIVRMLDSGIIQKMPGQNNESYEQYLFGQLMLIPAEIMKLYQSFDYSYNNPTIILFKNQESSELQREDAVLLVFLNMIGFDVVIFNPEGTVGIENYLTKSIMKTHRLEKISFDLTRSQVDEYINGTKSNKSSEGFFSLIKKITKLRQ